MKKTLLTTTLLFCLTACQPNQSAKEFAFDKVELPANSVLAPWTGPYQGVPAFDSVSLGDLKPGLEWGMHCLLYTSPSPRD